MKKIIALFLALTMLLSLAACGKKEPGISAADKLGKLPAQQEEPEKPEAPVEKEAEQDALEYAARKAAKRNKGKIQ